MVKKIFYFCGRRCGIALRFRRLAAGRSRKTPVRRCGFSSVRFEHEHFLRNFRGEVNIVQLPFYTVKFLDGSSCHLRFVLDISDEDETSVTASCLDLCDTRLCTMRNCSRRGSRVLQFDERRVASGVTRSRDFFPSGGGERRCVLFVTNARPFYATSLFRS